MKVRAMEREDVPSEPQGLDYPGARFFGVLDYSGVPWLAVRSALDSSMTAEKRTRKSGGATDAWNSEKWGGQIGFHRAEKSRKFGGQAARRKGSFSGKKVDEIIAFSVDCAGDLGS